MTSLINSININRNIDKPTKITNSNENNKSYLLNEPIKDTLEIKQNQEESKKTSLKKKIGFSAALGLATYVGFLIYKARFSDLKKLAEHIDFEPAKTIEEAIAFAKDKLGIKKVVGFESEDLEVLNWVNQGFVNASNANKGKLVMPKFLAYDTKNLDENTMAGVVHDVKSKFYGWFGINKNYFKNMDSLVKASKEYLEKFNILTFKSGAKEFIYNGKEISEQNAQKIVSMFRDFDANTLDISGKVFLSEITNHFYANFYREFLSDVKEVAKNDKFLELLKKEGLDIEQLLAPVSNNKIAEYSRIFYKLIKGCNIKLSDKAQEKSTRLITPYKTVYHELGHLQDNLPRALTIDYYDFDKSKFSNDLLKWVNNKEYIEAAQDVSWYATHGPGEFIAEVYAELILGNKLSDKAMKVYKKLSGPIPANCL